MGFKIINIDKDQDYEGWLNYRSSGIGASEVGTILGLNPWKSSIELFYQKLGLIPQKIDENMAMFMGNRLEGFVADMWTYYDGSQESIIKNFNEGNQKRFIQESAGYIVNDKYPHIFLSPDRIIIEEGKPAIVDNTVIHENIKGVLEVKTISGFASKQWDNGVPPSYIAQITTYLIGLEVQYGELVFLEDGRNINVFPIEKLDFMVEKILSAVDEFWDRVTSARNDMEHADLYAPEPDGTESYSKFLSQKYAQSEAKTMKGSPELYNLGLRMKTLNEQIKDIEGEVRLASAFIKAEMKEHETLDFAEKGKITWKTDSRGVRSMKNGLK
jgi:putative phage-type endonuclease